MHRWFRKFLVLSITILTFGLVTPPQILVYGEDKVPKSNAIETDSEEFSDIETVVDLKDTGLIEESPLSEKEENIRRLLQGAEEKSYLKFGSKIKPVIEDEFKEVILPNIEKAIELTAAQFEDENLKHLEIIEEPSGGYSEKIFHIADSRTNRDVIRFHVRKDHPPLEGYWFNFHYHTAHDQFQTHYDLGSIYWDKNTPPKWLS